MPCSRAVPSCASQSLLWRCQRALVPRVRSSIPKPVRIVVGYAPGGATDITARLLAHRLSDRLKQEFVIENRPGAATNVATEFVARSERDGHTLPMATAANAINATLYGERPPFNFVTDFAPVAGVARMQNVLEVHPSVPARSLPEFIAYAKANPGRLAMGSAGSAVPAMSQASC